MSESKHHYRDSLEMMHEMLSNIDAHKALSKYQMMGICNMSADNCNVYVEKFMKRKWIEISGKTKKFALTGKGKQVLGFIKEFISE